MSTSALRRTAAVIKSASTHRDLTSARARKDSTSIPSKAAIRTTVLCFHWDAKNIAGIFLAVFQERQTVPRRRRMRRQQWRMQSSVSESGGQLQLRVPTRLRPRLGWLQLPRNRAHRHRVLPGSGAASGRIFALLEPARSRRLQTGHDVLAQMSQGLRVQETQAPFDVAGEQRARFAD